MHTKHKRNRCSKAMIKRAEAANPASSASMFHLDPVEIELITQLVGRFGCCCFHWKTQQTSVVYLRLSRNPTPLDSPRQPSDVQQHRPWPLQLQRQESHVPVLLQNLQKDQPPEKSSTNEETQTSQNGGLTCTI